MSEARKFQMHEKLLLDVIRKQAGSIQKAVLEGVMNSIEAQASRVEIKLSPKLVEIEDDGKGFQNKKEIELFFETFGQPHDASEGKKWAQFRMGRGQMFAFGINEWRTGTFRMAVDINKKLGYDLEEDCKELKGCSIKIDLYDRLTDGEEYAIGREVERYVKYVNVPVIFNGKQINTPPDNKKWGPESNEAAYIRITEAGARLEVYNMGVLVCDVPKYVHGVSGTIISKQRLEVNFARNDIIKSCPVWRKIKQAIEASSGVQKIKQKRSNYSDDERLNLVERRCSGEISARDFDKMAIFLDITGHSWSIAAIRKANFPCWSFASSEDARLGDKLMKTKQALVLDEGIVSAFDCKPEKLFEEYCPTIEQVKYVPFSQLIKNINLKQIVLPVEQWRPSEFLWQKVIGLMNHYLHDYGDNYENHQRRIMIGSSDSANGWTDGTSYIVISREYLQQRSLFQRERPNIKSLIDVATLLLHELCHDDDDSHANGPHGPEFYKQFHDRTRGNESYMTLGIAVCNVQRALTGKWFLRAESALKRRKDAGDPEAPIAEEPGEGQVLPSEPAKIAADQKVAKKSRPAGPGRTAKEVTDAAEIKRIWSAYKGNGGKLSYEGIEKDRSFKLRIAGGMTAHRICKKHKP